MPTELSKMESNDYFPPDILSALFESVDDGILVSDKKGRIVFGNKAATRINDDVHLPANADERINQFETELGNFNSHMKLEDLPSLRAIREGEVKGQEIILVSSKGQKKHLSCNSRALYSSTGERVGAVVVFHDRTSLHTAIDQKRTLEKERNELLTLNRQLEQFSAVAAHDLKSPLNSITQFVELLKEELADKAGPMEIELLDYISNAGDRLRSLIDDLLTYARAGSGLIEKGEVNLGEEVNEILTLLKLEIKKTNASVIVNSLPTIFANKVGIHQLLQNLISNALKYRKSDSPKIQIASIEQETEWLISIQDNGIGMKASDLEHAFELFKRFENGAEREGTGLGLPICKRIVESHGGSIWIDSQQGIGTTIFFTIPKMRESGPGLNPFPN